MNRLGWLTTPRDSLAIWDSLARFAEEARRAGYDRTLVCGMGGSSLAPRVLARSFGAAGVEVLDSTVPAAVVAVSSGPIDRTLFLISSKSGGTVETLAFYHHFAALADPSQFVAVTDPGSPLESLARSRKFRAVFPHPVDVGGRFAALTVVGMLPAALAGVDGRELLQRAVRLDPEPAQALGRALGAASLEGRTKLWLRPPAAIAELAAWIEQLVAESTGKAGRGILPIVGAGVAGDRSDVESVVDFSSDPLDLGMEFYRWEFATQTMGEAIGVNPFDQPDVEAAKVFAREELQRLGAGERSRPPATLTPGDLRRAARPGDYLAILAYLPPFPDVVGAMERVRAVWGNELNVPTTLGFGPSYLHSTGQLHKGGPNTGLFLVITAEDPVDREIPTMGRTFGQLKQAQAVGDLKALLARGRRVAHVHLPRPDDFGSLLSI